jgi:uncharacterized zinc-type alcohol dehydrogenase-like protein
MLLVTINQDLDWDAYINMLKPGGKLHVVGATPPMKANVFALVSGEKSIGGSPIGGPGVIKMMLDFCDRHKITPVTEQFPLSKVNEAMNHLKDGKARYRLVLENDFR